MQFKRLFVNLTLFIFLSLNGNLVPIFNGGIISHPPALEGFHPSFTLLLSSFFFGEILKANTGSPPK